MSTWSAFPHLGEYHFDATSLAREWPRLHAGDAEPLPEDPAVLDAWVLLHNGEFQRAVKAGLQAGGRGITAANKASCVYANYLEQNETTRLAIFCEVAARAQAQAVQEPTYANAWFWQAFAIGRHSQGISVARALAQGLGGQVKEALETTIKLQPRHADAHIALGAFHAEVIDKVGTLVGGMTHGASKEVGLKLFEDALKINPRSAIGMIEYANGLMMLEGEQRTPQATALYERAAAFEPADAIERLEVELARAQLVE
jgi:hypothetical protein